MQERLAITKNYIRKAISFPLITALIFLLFISFIFYNYITLTSKNWFFHPDERDAYTIAYENYINGNYFIKLSSEYNSDEYVPDGSSLFNGRIVPSRSIGIFYLISPSFLFGKEAPFYLVSICGLILVSIIYQLIKEISGGIIAIYTSFFFSISPHIIYWNNMLFSNIPALMFFIFGIYLFNKENVANLNILIGIAFANAIFMRYEYILLIILFLLSNILLERTKQNFYKISLVLVFISLFISPLFYLNKNLYGNPFSFGYTQKTYDFASKTAVDYSLGDDLGFLAILEKYITRFSGQFTNVNFVNHIFVNINQYIYLLLPVTSVLSLAGFYIISRKEKIGSSTTSLIVVGLFIIFYFGSASTYNGYGKNWLSSSYTRYFAIVVLLISYFSSLTLRRIAKNNHYFVIFIFASYLFFSIFTTLNAQFGLNQTKVNKEYYWKINNFANSTPENTIVISNFYSKAIIGRHVLIPRQIKLEDYSLNKNVTNKVNSLLDTHHIIVMENINHPTFLNLYESFIEDERFHIQIVDNINQFYLVNH